jgi:thiosulfate dehydrogenase (quinone) large subunit
MFKNQVSEKEFSKMQIFALTFLRVLIGWHFLYEGLVKSYAPGGWTSEFFLLNSVGPVSPLLKMIAGNETLLFWVDQFNIWGLIIIGAGLFIGLFAKPLKILGIILLFLYYISYPPLAYYSTGIVAEGSNWIVNKTLIELGAILVLYFFPSSHITGIDRYLKKHSYKI